MGNKANIHTICMYILIFLQYAFSAVLAWYVFRGGDSVSIPRVKYNVSAVSNDGADRLIADTRNKRQILGDILYMEYISASDDIVMPKVMDIKLNADYHDRSPGVENDLCQSIRRCNIQGPPGQPGGRGPQGYKGDKGERGYTGVPGSLGNPGPLGPPGKPGMPGPMGPPGPKGEEGLVGLRGQLGPQGPKGEIGSPGIKGEPGDKGTRGLLGFPGKKGDSGDKGEMGEPGFPGNQGKTGQRGLKGDKGSNGTRGDTGRRGRKGPEGPRGHKGFQGPQGEQGLKGEKGDRGEIGLPNTDCNCIKGDKGDKGIRGQIGFTGFKGDKGIPGKKGEMGFSLSGQKGEKGEKGDCEVVMADWKIATGDPEPNSINKPGCSNVTESDDMSTPVLSTQEEVTTTESTSTTPTTTSTSTSTTTTQQTVVEPRKRVCTIRQIGTPLLERSAGPLKGAWLIDSAKSTTFPVWETRGNFGKYIYEYRTKDSFLAKREDVKYNLGAHVFRGSNHAVYNGSLFYQTNGSKVACFDFMSRSVVSGFTMTGPLSPLYRKSNFFDIEIDENAMWIIYASDGHIVVKRVDIASMRVQKTIKVKADPSQYGNGFVACGVLYLIQSTSIQKSKITFAYDLYKEKEVKPMNMKFINPFGGNSFVTYIPDRINPRNSQLYGWDNGRQISYKLLFG